MFTRRETEKTERERYLESEVERYREAEERRAADDLRRRKSHQAEIHERVMEYRRTASDWPEALRKSIPLHRREISGHPDEADLDALFENTAQACERALQLWSTAERQHQSEIEELEKRIADIRDGIRLQVAADLDEIGIVEFGQVAESLRTSTPEEFLQW